MKQSEQTKDTPLLWDFDQPWSSIIKPAARLCLNTFDFSDLWDEEDSTEDEGTSSVSDLLTCTGSPPGPLPLPPPPPPLPTVASPSPPLKQATKSRTLKLHWREMKSLPPLPRMTRFGTQTIWAALEPVHLDTNRLEYLFESKVSGICFSAASGRQVNVCFNTVSINATCYWPDTIQNIVMFFKATWLEASHHFSLSQQT